MRRRSSGASARCGNSQEALEDAIDAQASVLVTILAPPGVGKSRLAAAFAAEAAKRATVLVGQTPSYGEGVTFAPLVELLAQAAGTTIAGTPRQLRVRCASGWLAQPDGPSVGDRLAQVLGVGEAVGADASWAVRRLLEVLASERPLVVMLDDLHWAEPPMLDLADAVIERVHGPVLFLCLARPELVEQRPTWAAGKPRAITTTLPPLSPEDARTVGELLLGRGTPPCPSSTGSARRPRGIRSTWSSSRRCSRIKGCSSTAAGRGRTMPTSRSRGHCRRSSPPGSIASTPARA